MKWMQYIKLIILIACLIFLSKSIIAEQLQLQSYYPAPFGAYDRIRLVPRETIKANPYCDGNDDLGIIYYNKGDSENTEGLYVCQRTSKGIKWVYASVPVQREESEFEGQNKVICIAEEGGFGVCLNNPSMDGTCACQK